MSSNFKWKGLRMLVSPSLWTWISFMVIGVMRLGRRGRVISIHINRSLGAKRMEVILLVI
jgi:hypothetical protein